MRLVRHLCWLLGMLVVVVAGAAEARVLAGASFPGEGWNQSAAADSVPLPLSFAGVGSGSFSFDLRRTGDIAYAEPETLFELVDADGGRVLRVKVSWTSGDGSGFPTLAFRGEGGGGDYQRHGVGLWGPVIELDRAVAPGASVRVDLTWDDGARTYAAYADGRALAAVHGGYDPARRRWYPDPRLGTGGGQGKKDRQGEFDSQPLGFFLSRVAAVHLGNYEAAGPPATRPRSLLRNASIESFTVFADEIPPPGARPAPVIDAVDHDAARVAGFSGKLVAGDAFEVTLRGTTGATGSFDLVHYPDLGGTIALDWRGWGVPLAPEPFPGEGEVDLADVAAYRVYASLAPFDLAAPAIEPVARLGVERQSHTLELLEVDRPYYVAVLAEMRDGALRPVIAPIVDRPLVETGVGVYTGSCRVGWQDRLARAAVVGRLARGTVSSTLVAARAFAVDPALSLAVQTEPAELPADEKSAARVTVTVTDANGDAVAGQKVGFVLATTSQYTGVVGGGAFADQVGGTLPGSAWGETDLFGRLTATYVAGFAAKTAIVVARALASNDTGAGWVKTFIRATAGLELEPLAARAAAGQGYEITVSSSDAWLTADGRSQARISARVTLRGEPVPGHAVEFEATAGMGSIRVTRGVTDRDGVARAVYTAGRKTGVAVVTATDAAAGVGGSVRIELRSDAPAKIAIRVDPGKLPADGRSRAGLLVRVTDVNDNPNEKAQIEYRIVSGDGSLRDEAGVTDRDGEHTAEYTAGRSPGPVVFEVTVRSTVPTPEELVAARGLAVAVPETD